MEAHDMQTNRATLNIPALGDYLGICARAARTLIEEGRINVIRIGSRVIVPIAEADRFIAENTAGWTPAAVGRGASKAKDRAGT
jgi:hypothetical protein